jgi:4-amino-4-deoxychorismate lyase
VTEDPVVALLDGTVLPVDAPLLRPDDAGVTRGDGVFETTLVVDGEPRDLPEHLQRLRISADLLDLALPAPDGWLHAVGAAVKARTPAHQQVLRLFATRGPEHGGGPTCWVSTGPMPAASLRERRDGIRVLTLDSGTRAAEAQRLPWLLAGAKTLSYARNLAAQRWATAHDADDVIFVDPDGRVTEGPRSSVVAAFGDTLVSPPVDGILDGITVRRLLAAASAAGWTVQRRPLAVTELAAADGIWLTSSIRLLARVRMLDGTSCPDGDLGATLAALLQVPTP